MYVRFNLSLRDVEELMAERGVEVSYETVRRRERTMQGFRSPGPAQRFLSIHAAVYSYFTTRRHLISATEHRHCRDQAFTAWRTAAYAAA